MLSFLRRKSIKPVPPGLDVPDIPFSPQEIFCMLSGFDIANFACGDWTLERRGFEDAEQEGFRSWKEKTVKRLSPGGYVDEACVPNPLLATVLNLLRDPDFIVMSGQSPVRNTDSGARSFCMYMRGGLATFVSGKLDDTYVINLESQPRPQWNNVLMEALRLKHDYHPALCDYSMALADVKDVEFNEVLQAEDDETIRSFAVRRGFAPEPLLETAYRLRDREWQYRIDTLCSFDLSRGSYAAPGEGSPYVFRARLNGDYRVRRGVLTPAAGFMTSQCAVRRPRPDEHAVAPSRDDPPSEYLALDWLHDRTLIDMLLDIPPYPEELADDPWTPDIAAEQETSVPKRGECV